MKICSSDATQRVRRAAGLALRSVLLAVVLMLTGLSVMAADQNGASAPDCEQATTTAAMRTCENARYEKAERDLNATYQQLMRQLDPGQQAKLRVAQDAWLRFRETNADFEAGTASGGTLGPLLRVSTLADMTEVRTAELKKSLQQ
jgi:uncharacterized protein YecT (DUF1311 family)